MSQLRKGAITRRGVRADPASKVVESNGSDSTRDTYQRKVFYDGNNFFVVYLDSVAGKIKYVASANGKTWTTPITIWSAVPYYGGNVDIGYPNRGTLDYDGNSFDVAMHLTGCLGAKSIWQPFAISGQTLTMKRGADLGGPTDVQGASLVSSLNGTYDYMIYHRNTVYDRVYIVRSPATQPAYLTTVPYGNGTTGGNQLLPYKTSSPYNLLALAKGSDNKLYYNTVNEPAGTFIGSFAEIATLGTGFSDFCACSEAQNAGDPEIIHLIYVKSTGELFYQKFESDAWSGETILVQSGASYPVIACGAGGKLYVFYVKSGKIMMRKFDGSQWLSEKEPFVGHGYHTPTYLSSNQNVQNGLICLVWTEGTASPYKVWFCYLED